MPPPPPPMIMGIAAGALQSAGLGGIGIPQLATALGMCTSQALMVFVGMLMVSPGQAAVVDPLSGSGATAGPGTLTGSLPAAAAQGMAVAALAGVGLIGTGTPGLGLAYGTALSKAAGLFVDKVQGAPGAAVAGFTTTAPAALMGSPPSDSELKPICKDALDAEGIKGEAADPLAGALALVIAGSLAALQGMCKVMPGVGCTPAATASPGKVA